VVKLSGILDFFDDVGSVLVSPESAFRRILDEKAAKNGIYALIFFAVFLGLMIGAAIAGFTNIFLMPVLFAVIILIVALVKILIWSVISHIIAKIVFKGKGDFSNLFQLFGYTSVTYILGIFGIMTLILAGTIFPSALLWLIMVVWIIIVATAAVNAEHKIGLGKAFLSCFGIPALIIIAIFLILGVL
jgi:hypothetical protein